MPSTPQARTTPKRRLLLVVILLLGIVGAGGGLYLWMLQRRSSHIEGLKPEGIALVEQGAYRQALTKLKGYLGANPNDLPALKAYAEARQQVFERGGKHLREVINVRRRILEIDPGDQATRRALMQQYVRVGFFTEAVEQADRILHAHPADPQALRVKARALAGQQESEQAYALAVEYLELEPNDVEMHMLAVNVLHDAGRPEREILEHVVEARYSAAAEQPQARQQRVVDLMARWNWSDTAAERTKLSQRLDRHDRPGAFMAVLGLAYHLTGDLNRAREAYRQAAHRLPSDPGEVGRLARLMDRLGLHTQSTKLLSRAEQVLEDPAIERLYARRLWERGAMDRLLQRAEAADAADSRIHTDTLGVYALALVTAHRHDAATPLVEALERRSRDSLAESWSSVLRALMDEQLEPARLERITAAALTRHTQQPYFHFYHGQALAGQGEVEEAIQAWQAAAERAPAWPKPLVRMSQAFLGTSRPSLAAMTAQAAVQRGPTDLQANIVFLQTLSLQVDKLTDEQIESLSERIAKFGAELPEHARPFTVPIQAALRARAGRTDEARAMIDKLLSRDGPVNMSVLLQLASISEKYDLGLADQCLDAATGQSGMNPTLAMRAALRQAPAQGADAALAAYERARDEARPANDRMTGAWRITRARLMERLNHRDVVAAWSDLVEQYDDDQRALTAAAASDAIWRDRELARGVVNRLQALAGPDSRVSRQARARLLMTDPEAGQRELAEATSLLLDVTRDAPYLLEPHLRLADCFQRMENIPRALELLEEAQALAPHSLDIAIRRAGLLQRADRDEQARGLLRRIQDRAGATIDQRIRIAALQASHGDLQAAEKALRQILEQAPDHTTAKLYLANLLRDMRRTEQARDLFEQLLENPDGRVIRSAIAFHEAQGDHDAVQRLIDKLSEHPEVSQADRAALRARAALRQGHVDKALARLREITEAGEATPQLWRQLIAIQLQTHRVEQALSSAAVAAERHPGQDVFARVVDHADLVRGATNKPALQRLAAAMLSSPQFSQTAIRALRLLLEAERTSQSAAEVITSLRALADRHPRFLALQDLTIQLYWRLGRREDMAELAERTMRVMPGSVEAAWLAANALSATGHWNKAQDAAWEYQRRLGSKTLVSDMLIAESQLRLGRGDQVADQLQPYFEGRKTGRATGLINQMQARALLQQGQVQQARELLKPTLAESRSHRMAYLRLAVSAVPNRQAQRTWLADLERAMPDPAPGERLTLALGWQDLGRRHGHAPFRQAATEQLKQLVDDPNVGPYAWQALGVQHETGGRLDEAVDAYRQALQGDPNLAVAHNNLAMMLIRRDTPDAALPHARQAVQIAPRRAAFQDTHALALMGAGQPAQAVEAARKAASLERGRPEFYVTLGQALVEADRLEEARDLLDRLDRAIRPEMNLPADLARRLDALRRKLGAGDPAGAAAGAAGAAVPDR